MASDRGAAVLLFRPGLVGPVVAVFCDAFREAVLGLVVVVPAAVAVQVVLHLRPGLGVGAPDVKWNMTDLDLFYPVDHTEGDDKRNNFFFFFSSDPDDVIEVVAVYVDDILWARKSRVSKGG